jgi:tRNA threonylcarbamoyladenosine biosynthesis protein TsaE
MSQDYSTRSQTDSYMVTAPRAADMRAAGAAAASVARGGDVIVLSGPLGAGKTTFAQGFGAGLHVEGQVVSPTFTIARSLAGRFADGSPANLVHVDAYRLPGSDDQPQVAASRLMDELESLGLDEELEDPGPGTVVLIEWGSAMASESVADVSKGGRSADDAPLTSDGARTVTFHAIGCADRMPALIAALQAAQGAMTER